MTLGKSVDISRHYFCQSTTEMTTNYLFGVEYVPDTVLTVLMTQSYLFFTTTLIFFFFQIISSLQQRKQNSGTFTGSHSRAGGGCFRSLRRD